MWLQKTRRLQRRQISLNFGRKLFTPIPTRRSADKEHGDVQVWTDKIIQSSCPRTTLKFQKLSES